ncbi:MAG TPA: BON domain-containing protein [Polyangiaceae bacterium]|nr:BON domain-containing protein [Polyangiaceae bacterium]
MRTDSEIREAIRAELGWDVRVRETDVCVEVQGGVVALTGSIGSWAERRAAVGAATATPGVCSVEDRLRIEP